MFYILQGWYTPDLCDLYDLYDLYDPAHDAGREPYNLHDLRSAMSPGLDLYDADPVQHPTTAGGELLQMI